MYAYQYRSEIEDIEDAIQTIAKLKRECRAELVVYNQARSEAMRDGKREAKREMSKGSARTLRSKR